MASADELWSLATEAVTSRQTADGYYVAFEDAGQLRLVPMAREWTRVGRSMAADVRFDDATVSRRHALFAVQADGVRVLDDRSLNGIAVNGRRVEWSPLVSGDVVRIGRYEILFLEVESGRIVGGPSRRGRAKLPTEWEAQIGPVWTEQE